MLFFGWEGDLYQWYRFEDAEPHTPKQGFPTLFWQNCHQKYFTKKGKKI